MSRLNPATDDLEFSWWWLLIVIPMLLASGACWLAAAILAPLWLKWAFSGWWIYKVLYMLPIEKKKGAAK